MDDILIFITTIFVISTAVYLVLPVLPIAVIVYLIAGWISRLLD